MRKQLEREPNSPAKEELIKDIDAILNRKLDFVQISELNAVADLLKRAQMDLHNLQEWIMNSTSASFRMRYPSYKTIMTPVEIREYTIESKVDMDDGTILK
jgi:hypothetical protein